MKPLFEINYCKENYHTRLKLKITIQTYIHGTGYIPKLQNNRNKWNSNKTVTWHIFYSPSFILLSQNSYTGGTG